MGTWGHTIFEDDTAMEYYDQFCLEGLHILQIESIINEILKKEYSLNGDLLIEGFEEPSIMLVVAEIVAMAKNKPISTFPNDSYHRENNLNKVDIKSIQEGYNDELKLKVISVLRKIRDNKNMHLTTLWKESDYYNEWKNYLNNLIKRVD